MELAKRRAFPGKAFLIFLLTWMLTPPLLADVPIQNRPSPNLTAVATYESVGVYWKLPSGGNGADCKVQFTKLNAGPAGPAAGHPLWYDSVGRPDPSNPTVRIPECRGSIVGMLPDSYYRIEVALEGQDWSQGYDYVVRTWPNQRKIARVVYVQPGSTMLSIIQGGSASAGYVVYDGMGGTRSAPGQAAAIDVHAPFVIIRNFVITGGSEDGIRIEKQSSDPDLSDIVVEDNEISGWGRQCGTYGCDRNSGVHAICSGTPVTKRLTIQRNNIHDPAYSANSWLQLNAYTGDKHPAGPQGITLENCGGSHVIRHNTVYNSSGNYFNDAIGGLENFSTTGFPNSDSDIYENKAGTAYDDAIEVEGGDMNVRVWKNFTDRSLTSIASTPDSVGPLYAFRNVWSRSEQDSDGDKGEMFKSGTAPSLGTGRRYLYHNTMLQYGFDYSQHAGGQGGASGVSDAKVNDVPNGVQNTISKNNLYFLLSDAAQAFVLATSSSNLSSNDNFNLNIGDISNPLNPKPGLPTFAAGMNADYVDQGNFQLSSASAVGLGAGTAIPNFNDGTYLDLGAQDRSAAPNMLFGPKAALFPRDRLILPRLRANFVGPASPYADIAWVTQGADQDSMSYALWLHGAGPGGSTAYPGVAPPTPDSALSQIADFNGDGKSDILWRSSDGTFTIFLMDGATVLNPTTGQIFTQTGNPAWYVLAAADLDGDGKADLLWRNTDGVYGYWYMDGAQRKTMPAGQVPYGSISPPTSNSELIAVADFNGDHRADLLWRDKVSGTVTVQYWAGAQASVATGLQWTLAFVADLNGDGRTDLIWRDTSGQWGYWFMGTGGFDASSGFRAGYIAVPTAPSPTGPWRIALVGDFNGDGKSDLLWTDDQAAGRVDYITADTSGNLAKSGGFDITTMSFATWMPVQAGDYDGNGLMDVLLRDTGGGYGKLTFTPSSTYSFAVSFTAAQSGGWNFVDK